MWHLLGFVIPGLTLYGNIMGTYWVCAGVITALIIFPLIESFIGVDSEKRSVRKKGLAFEIILIVHALLMIPMMISICYRGMVDGYTWTLFVAAISTGITTGISGIIVAHELGHKKRYSIRWYIGRLLLYFSLYSHFTTEHHYIHHRYVGTIKDSASAPKGRGFWHHFFQPAFERLIW